MAFLGTGTLMIWCGIAPGTEDDYSAWHSRQHMPERLSVPGFLRGRRWVGVEGTDHGRKWFMMYEAETPEVFASPPYLARLNDPTDWSQRVLTTFQEPNRTACRIVASGGVGLGEYLATVEIEPDHGPASEAVMTGSWLETTLAQAGIVSAHAVIGAPDISGQQTAERKLRESRGEIDRTIGGAFMIEGLDEAATRSALDNLLAALDGRIGGTLRANLYRTQHVVRPDDF